MNHNLAVSARWVAFVVWAALAASAVFWVMRLFASPIAVPADAVTVGQAGPLQADLGVLFGRAEVAAQDAVVPIAPSRFKLLGVVTPQQGRDAGIALALISVDDQPAKAYRVGAVVDGQTVLQSVGVRGANLGPRGGATAALELPPPAAASTGTLPSIMPAAPGPNRPVFPPAMLVRPAPLPAPEPQGTGDAQTVESLPAPGQFQQRQTLETR